MYRCLVLKNNSLEVYSPFSVKLPGNTRDRVTADVASFALYRSAKWHLSPSPPPTNRPILKLHTTKASEYNHVFTLYWPLHSLKLPSTSPVTHQKIKSLYYLHESRKDTAGFCVMRSRRAHYFKSIEAVNRQYLKWIYIVNLIAIIFDQVWPQLCNEMNFNLANVKKILIGPEKWVEKYPVL